jgi:hypothetical protein
MTRDELLALTPAQYLAEGWTTADGAPRRELTGIDATAASTQFLAAELSPQELALTAEAVRQILPQTDEPPGPRAHEASMEALGLVGRAIGQTNNQVLARWLIDCADRVRTEADLAAFLRHLTATERQYSLVAELSQPPSSAAS